MSIHNIPFKGLKNEFETAVVDEPSVFEPPKFYCIMNIQLAFTYSETSMFSGKIVTVLE